MKTLISLTLMKSNKIESYKKKIKLTNEQKQLIFGKMLGDGHLESQNNGKTYRLKIEHSIKQKDYVDWQYKILQNLVLTPPTLKIARIGDIKYVNYRFSTLSLVSLRFFAHQFYKNNEKIIPKLIHRWLTPFVMAVWFMDDGSIKSNRNRALILNTQSFSRNDTERLKEVLEKKFEIKTKLRIQKRKNIGYQLYFLSDTVSKFVNIIQPFILPSMKYKLGKLNNILPKK